MTVLPEMPCREFVERVTDYLEDALSADDLARLETHLDECPHCRLYLDQVRTTLRLTGRLRVDDVPAECHRELLDAFDRWRAEDPERGKD